MPKNMSKPTLLFWGFGVLYLLAAVIVNPFFIDLIFPSLPKDSIIPPFFSRLRYGFCIFGLVWIGLGWGLNRMFQSHSLFQKEGVLNTFVFLLAFGFPLLLLEGISPPESAMNKTTIFQQDEKLGWTLKPNATG
ncbi:hypothetical protein GF373_09300, partial [bacterium]|nr:hypothetical protein [bacterium]